MLQVNIASYLVHCCNASCRCHVEGIASCRFICPVCRCIVCACILKGPDWLPHRRCIVKQQASLQLTMHLQAPCWGHCQGGEDARCMAAGSSCKLLLALVALCSVVDFFGSVLHFVCSLVHADLIF